MHNNCDAYRCRSVAVGRRSVDRAGVTAAIVARVVVGLRRIRRVFVDRFSTSQANAPKREPCCDSLYAVCVRSCVCALVVNVFPSSLPSWRTKPTFLLLLSYFYTNICVRETFNFFYLHNYSCTWVVSGRNDFYATNKINSVPEQKITSSCFVLIFDGKGANVQSIQKKSWSQSLTNVNVGL